MTLTPATGSAPAADDNDDDGFSPGSANLLVGKALQNDGSEPYTSTASQASSLLPVVESALKAPVQVRPSKPRGLQALGFNLLIPALRSMQHGVMHLTLPNGKQEMLGAATRQQESKKSLLNPLNATLQVNHWDFFKSLLLNGHIGAGESYMRGEWDSPDVMQVLAWFLLNHEQVSFFEGSPAKTAAFNTLGWLSRLAHALRPNTPTGSQRNIQEHYDLGNAFFQLFLDKPTLSYSSGYYQHPEMDLDGAQQAKLERLCRLLQLQPGLHVLEIGSGWGGMAFHLASQYGCKVTTVTLSTQQAQYVKEEAARRGLSERVDVLLQDYRSLRGLQHEGQYDRLVSIEMLEAVGDAYYETFFRQCNRLLKPQGLMALQVITCPDSRFNLLKQNVDFIQKYIFPGSLLPSLARLHQAASRSGSLFLHDVKDMTPSYARTLADWAKRVTENHSAILGQGYSETFYRKWQYYLAYCQAAFQVRHINVVQLLYSRPNNPLLMDADLRLS